MTERNGRTRRERVNADNLKSQRRQPCGRCGQQIRYDLAWPDPESFSAGHIKSWAEHPELREDPANLRQEHLRCNQSAHTNEGLGIGINSRVW